LGLLFGKSPDGETENTVNAIYMTPSESNQLALIPDLEGLQDDQIPEKVLNFKKMSIYFTRLQKERGANPSTDGAYPSLTRERLKQKQLSDISILHPLPRIEEIAPDVDDDPRSLYFEQARFGLPIRMALIWHVLGMARGNGAPPTPYKRRIQGSRYKHAGFSCDNQMCITKRESQFASAEFEIIDGASYVLRCLYCDHEYHPGVIGNKASKLYYSAEASSRWRKQTSLSNLRFFDSIAAAKEARFAAAEPTRSRKEPPNNGPKADQEWVDVVKT